MNKCVYDTTNELIEKQRNNIFTAITLFIKDKKLEVHEGYFDVFDKVRNYFNEDLIVVAHSIGNPMFIKYISKNELKIGKYISLAGFSKDFFNEGKDVLNEKVKLTILTEKELNDAKVLINEKYSIYSDSDHLVPLELLEQYCSDIKSVAIPMKDIGHMGKKSGLEKLPKVIELIEK